VRFEDTAEYVPLGAAAAMVERRGASLAEAKEFVTAAVESRRLPYRIWPPFPPDELLARPAGLDLRGEAIDWAASEVTVLDRYPKCIAPLAWASRPARRRARLAVHRATLRKLIELAAEASAGQPREGAQPAHHASREPTAEAAKGSVSARSLKPWLERYVREHKAAGTEPTRGEVETAARNSFPGKSVDRSMLRQFKKELAPEWSKPGPKSGRKVLAAKMPN
jgi:hypothetical protein